MFNQLKCWVNLAENSLTHSNQILELGKAVP